MSLTELSWHSAGSRAHEWSRIDTSDHESWRIIAMLSDEAWSVITILCSIRFVCIMTLLALVDALSTEYPLSWSWAGIWRQEFWVLKQTHFWWRTVHYYSVTALMYQVPMSRVNVIFIPLVCFFLKYYHLCVSLSLGIIQLGPLTLVVCTIIVGWKSRFPCLEA